ncbi:MAG: hypothetical protein U0P46_11025 [Holophagaceae bacterium]
MSRFGFSPNLGDFQREAWEKGLWLFPYQKAFLVDEWISEGLVELDLDGTLIGRHLGPEVSAFPLWGSRRPIGISSEGLVIPYDDPMALDSLNPIQVAWARIQAGYDATHFGLAAAVIVTLRLTEEAAAKVAKYLEVPHA